MRTFACNMHMGKIQIHIGKLDRFPLDMQKFLGGALLDSSECDRLASIISFGGLQIHAVSLTIDRLASTLLFGRPADPCSEFDGISLKTFLGGLQAQSYDPKEISRDYFEGLKINAPNPCRSILLR